MGDRQLTLVDPCPRGCIPLRTLPLETRRPQPLVPSQSAKETNVQRVAGKPCCGSVRIQSDRRTGCAQLLCTRRACTVLPSARLKHRCSGSRHHHSGSSSSRSDHLISSVRGTNCPGNRLTAQPSPNGRRGSRQSPGGNRSPKHSWVYQTAVGTTSPLSINPSPTQAPAAKVATPNAPNR